MVYTSTRTSPRIFCSIALQRHLRSSSTSVIGVDVAQRYSFLAMTFFAALLAMMLGASSVHAKTDEAPKFSALSNVAVTKTVIEMRGSCQGENAVFTVKNTAKRWAGRGHLRIYDGHTGHMLRERWMHFDEGQSASFHIHSSLVASARFKISVTLPDRSMTYKKSFRGRCVAPTVEANNIVGNVRR